MRIKALNNKVDPTALTGLVLLIVAIFIALPFAVIWSLNTLFNTGIAYGFYEWLAVIGLSAFLNTRVQK